MPAPIELYLIRHAIAAERGDEWPDDEKRPLTEDGIARMRKAARGLARLEVSLDIVFTALLVAILPITAITAAGVLADEALWRRAVVGVLCLSLIHI